MFRKRFLTSFFLIFYFGAMSLGWAQMPSSLLPWYQYALKIFPPQDCPHLLGETKTCVAVSQVTLSGDVNQGWLQVVWTGENFSLSPQTIDLIGPASTFTIDDSNVELEESHYFARVLVDDKSAAPFVGPFFDSSSGMWQATVPPGHFVLTGQVSFDVASVIPLKLTSRIGKLEDGGLTGGSVQFDPATGPSTGELTIVTKQALDQQLAEKPNVRVTRVFEWGSLAHFKYVVSVDGITKEASVAIPLLGGERIESVTPQRRTTQEMQEGVSVIILNVSPEVKQVTLEGHFKEKPTTLVASQFLPFEIWLALSDVRYPVEISTDATPIDPGEFANVTDVKRAHAYLVKSGQKITLTPVVLAVDEGRKGSGTLKYQLFQGSEGFWLEKLYFTGKLFGKDRLVMATPHDPVYAGFNAQGVELYHDDQKRLSVRIPPEGLQDLEVNWHEMRAQTPFVNLFRFKTAPQEIYQDEASGSVLFRRGVVPLFAWGAEDIRGDLRNEFHLYGLLIGIFVFFLCRALKFNMALALLTAVLFVGLYNQYLFPLKLTLFLFLITLPATLIKEQQLESLHRKFWLRVGLRFVWWCAFLLALLPLSDFAGVRVYSALHPEAEIQLTRGSSLFFLEREQQYTQQKAMEDRVQNQVMAIPNASPDDVIAISKDEAGAPKKNKTSLASKDSNQIRSQKDWKPRPVNIQTSGSEAQLWQNREKLSFSSRNLLEGQQLEIRAVVAGPVLRGMWMFLEAAIIFMFLKTLYMRARALARRADV